MKMVVNTRTGEVDYVEDMVIIDIPIGAGDELVEFVAGLNQAQRYAFAYLVGKSLDDN